MAYVGNLQSMLTILNRGVDLHQATADLVGVTRSQAKCINFGLPYGKSTFTLASDLNITQEKAKEYEAKVLGCYPEFLP
jgi:DNA polymerase-1